MKKEDTKNNTEIIEICPSRSIFFTINLVMKDLTKLGIGKDQKNLHQNYKYRGIDDVYNVLAKVLSENGLIICPTIIDHKQELIKNNSTRTLLQVKYTIYHIHNEQKMEAVVWGEALDTSDKSTNKALTSAYKYFVIQFFCIPINGIDQDADNQSLQLDNQNSEHDSAKKPEIITKGFIQNNASNLADAETLKKVISLFKEKKDLLSKDKFFTEEILTNINKAFDSQKMLATSAKSLITRLTNL